MLRSSAKHTAMPIPPASIFAFRGFGRFRVPLESSHTAARVECLGLSISISIIQKDVSLLLLSVGLGYADAHAGRPPDSSIPRTGTPNAKNTTEAATTAMTSMNTPVLFISLNANAPVDNVIVFGGVDVGKTNANEVASAVGTTNSRGLQLFPCASLAAIGTKIVAAPEFDTNSVNIDTIRNSSSTLKKAGMAPRGFNW